MLALIGQEWQIRLLDNFHNLGPDVLAALYYTVAMLDGKFGKFHNAYFFSGNLLDVHIAHAIAYQFVVESHVEGFFWFIVEKREHNFSSAERWVVAIKVFDI